MRRNMGLLRQFLGNAAVITVLGVALWLEHRSATKHKRHL